LERPDVNKEIQKALKGNNYQKISFPVLLSEKPDDWTTATIASDSTATGFGWSLDVNHTLKPMNCPESTVIYRFRQRSYKELPLRLAEVGRLHRREQSGEINGLLRVRQLTMDDAHIYVTENQILSEISNILDTVMDFYKNLGFIPEFKLATRPDKFIGTVENWNKAEKDLEKALKDKNLKYSIKEKDGAFYGPKIDIHIKDSQDRDWQMATVQIDFALPSKDHFDLKYIDDKGEQKTPVMIHRAIFGSFERFIAILTEHFQGAFPLWLSPVQVAIVPISDKHIEHSKKVADELKSQKVRVEVDSRSDTMQGKIRDATLQKVPYIVIIGDKEIEDSNLSVRDRSGKVEKVSLSFFLQTLTKEIDKKV
ncbi:MAG TPA: threonine--tRNA ligase, partial [Patescibacteria group bacterium]|nr:threonine--tRNA ligase [Patescibacteria group bacterium]